MAKGKSAVALFEVLSKDNRFSRKSPEIPPKTAEAAPSAEIAQKSPVPDSAGLAARAVDLWRKRNSDPETWTFSTVKVRQSVSARASGLKAACRGGLARSAKIAEAARAWIIRQNSIACGAAAAMVVIAGLMMGRHWYHPQPWAMPIERALRNGPAHPAVLAVAAEARSSRDSDSLSPEMEADVRQASDKTAPADDGAVLAQPGARIVNLHYVLMQSYFEEKTATEARDFLIEQGIACTIERGVKGWRRDFYQVIGLQGFTRPSGAQYIAYRHRIEDLGMKFSPKSRYKRFMPQAIKW